MLNMLASYALVVRDRMRTLNVLKSKAFVKERQMAAIIRLVHSIEKGLCIENPRLGFGVVKLNKLFRLCTAYANEFGNDEFCLKMARDAIKEYIEFHNQKAYRSEDFAKICEAYAVFPCKETTEGEIFGGVLHVKHECTVTMEQLERFFSERHSIRDFTGEEVTEDEIARAIRAAQYAPSACNRQAVRAYVLPSAKICEYYKNDLSGIGGFAEGADKFILITGKLSAYDKGEYNQHIVSASIFATYLVEALFAQKIGSCMVQRPLYYSTQWANLANKIGIPEDERLVLMIAVGKIKSEYMAPVSKRFPVDHVLRFVK